MKKFDDFRNKMLKSKSLFEISRLDKKNIVYRDEKNRIFSNKKIFR